MADSGAGLTERKYERTVAGLRGRRIMRIAYYPLACDIDVEDWDFGDWHQPTMGVVLGLDDGSWALATWNSSFGDWGLEVTVSPTRGGLRDIGPAGMANEVVVDEHERWKAFLASPLQSAKICWSRPPAGVRRQPVAVRLRAGGTRVWIAAGAPAAWPFDGRFVWGTDDVVVVFAPELAARHPELRTR